MKNKKKIRNYAAVAASVISLLLFIFTQISSCKIPGHINTDAGHIGKLSGYFTIEFSFLSPLQSTIQIDDNTVMFDGKFIGTVYEDGIFLNLGAGDLILEITGATKHGCFGIFDYDGENKLSGKFVMRLLRSSRGRDILAFMKEIWPDIKGVLK